MSKINLLPEHVADLIAAGEVCERPASVLKELIENSLDAGAKRITAELSGGGLAMLRVTDDGEGMTREDAGYCFLRHATSKLHDEKELEAVTTMGFRGEALAAASAVSRIELHTRLRGADAGTLVTIDGSGIPESCDDGCPDGTTMIIRELFYNTPARLKFMKRDAAEAAAAIAVVERASLARPDVSFRAIKDGREVLHTPGDGRLLSCIYCIYGREIANTLKPVDYTYASVRVVGYTCEPEQGRGNRSLQVFSVNNRPVRNRALSVALEEGYKNAMVSGKYPVCFLDIQTDASLVDVNVHPAKAEVKFVREREIFDAVYFAVKTAISKPEIQTERKPSPPLQSEKVSIEKPAEQTAILREYAFNAPSMGVLTKPEKTRADFVLPPNRQDLTETTDEVLPQSKAYDDKRPGMFVRGELFGVYMMAELGSDVYLIDKHAAHERIIYEKLLQNEGEPASQALLSPVVVRLSGDELALLLDNADELASAGFELEEFGGGSVAVRRVPENICDADFDALLSELAADIKAGKKEKTFTCRQRLLYSVACRAAVKAGDKTGDAENLAIAERVIFGGDITHCPHGRPVMIKTTKSELEKRFSRL